MARTIHCSCMIGPSERDQKCHLCRGSGISYGLSIQAMTLGQIFAIVGDGKEDAPPEPDLPDAPHGAISYQQAQKSFEAYFAENYPMVDPKQAPKLFGAAVTAIRVAKAMEGKSQ